MMLFNQPSPAEWTEQVVKQLKTLTDRPIEVTFKLCTIFKRRNDEWVCLGHCK